MSPSFTQRILWWFPAFIVAAFVLYWPTLSFTPFSDDHSALWNSGVRDIPWRTGFFRPLSDLSFRIGYQFGGTAVETHRSFNVLLHGVNAILLFVLCRQWSFARGAFFGATLFLVYPFHQESIVWLVGRESALGASAVLLGLIIAGSGLPSFLRLLLMSMILLLGSLCYESALLLLPLALLVTWSGLMPHWPRARKIALVLGSMTVIHFMLRSTGMALGDGGYLHDLFPKDPSAFLQRIPKTLARLFMPPEPDTSAQLIHGAVLLFALVMLVVLMRRAKEVIAVHSRIVLWTLLILLSCSIAVIAGVSTVTSESDRYLYLPSAFLCGMVGLLLSRMQRPVLRWGAFMILGIVSLWQTSINHANWRAASATTESCIASLPMIPEDGQLWVNELPSDHHGAFIFRNGFPEALDLHGKAGKRIIVVPSGVTLQEVLGNGLLFRGTHRTWGRSDQWYRWNGSGYTAEIPQ